MPATTLTARSTRPAITSELSHNGKCAKDSTSCVRPWVRHQLPSRLAGGLKRIVNRLLLVLSVVSPKGENPHPRPSPAKKRARGTKEGSNVEGESQLFRRL